VDALREGGHEVEYVADLWPGISDPEVLKRARASGSVLRTGDKDFGELVFRGQEIHLPQRCSYYPEDEYVDWHAREVFQGPGRWLPADDGGAGRSQG